MKRTIVLILVLVFCYMIADLLAKIDFYLSWDYIWIAVFCMQIGATGWYRRRE